MISCNYCQGEKEILIKELQFNKLNQGIVHNKKIINNVIILNLLIKILVWLITKNQFLNSNNKIYYDK